MLCPARHTQWLVVVENCQEVWDFSCFASWSLSLALMLAEHMGLYGTAVSMSFMFTLFDLVMGVIGKWAQVDTVHKMDSCHSWKTLRLENLSLLKMAASSFSLSQREKLLLYSNVVCYTHILENTVQNKSCYKPCRNTVQNCLPSVFSIIVISFVIFSLCWWIPRTLNLWGISEGYCSDF